MLSIGIHHIDGWLTSLYLRLMPNNWGYIETVRVGLDTHSYVRLHLLRRR
jgi:hypothetical protein